MISRPISKIVTWGVKITGPQDSFYSRSKNIIKCNEIIVNQPQVHITQLEYGIDQISFCISTIQCHKSISSLIYINKLQIAFRKHNINLKAIVSLREQHSFLQPYRLGKNAHFKLVKFFNPKLTPGASLVLITL